MIITLLVYTSLSAITFLIGWKIATLEKGVRELGDARLLQARRILELEARVEDTTHLVDHLQDRVQRLEDKSGPMAVNP